MRARRTLGVVIFCGAMGTLGGQTVQAQSLSTPNSTRFVKLLLLNEAAQIKADTKALNTRNRDVAKLDSLTNARQIRSLSATISRLNARILVMTAKLQLLSTQTVNTAVNLAPPNPTLLSQALAGLMAVQNLSVAVGLGVSPATPSL